MVWVGFCWDVSAALLQIYGWYLPSVISKSQTVINLRTHDHTVCLQYGLQWHTNFLALNGSTIASFILYRFLLANDYDNWIQNKFQSHKNTMIVGYNNSKCKKWGGSYILFCLPLNNQWQTTCWYMEFYSQIVSIYIEFCNGWVEHILIAVWYHEILFQLHF